LPVSFSLCLEHVETLGAYRIPQETGLLIPSEEFGLLVCVENTTIGGPEKSQPSIPD